MGFINIITRITLLTLYAHTYNYIVPVEYLEVYIDKVCLCIKLIIVGDVYIL